MPQFLVDAPVKFEAFYNIIDIKSNRKDLSRPKSNFKSKVQSPRSKVQGPKSKVQSPKSKVQRKRKKERRTARGSENRIG
jgi:hypothetical protein